MEIRKKLVTSSPRPFVKWAGSKTRVLPHLKKYIPKEFGVYFEPFVGGGAMFFYLSKHQPHFSRAFLSDMNEELINSYCVVRDHLSQLLSLLEKHQQHYARNPEEYYYSVRDGELSKDPIERAARTIFLNKTCYNGLYRVNKQGKFNVPFGTYKNPKICDKTNLTAVSHLLNRVKVGIQTIDYVSAVDQATEGDFLYLDPPYLPSTDTSNFTSYTPQGFSAVDQESLARKFRELVDRGCYVILSNSDTPLIRDLYSDFKIEVIQVTRMISCKGDAREGFTEVIIRG